MKTQPPLVLREKPPTARTPIQVVLIDPVSIVREALRRLIDGFEGVHVTASSPKFESVFGLERRPVADVGVIRMRPPESEWLATNRGVPLLFLTCSKEIANAVQAMRTPRIGVLDEDSSPEELLLAIRALAAGRTYTCASIVNALVQEATTETLRPALSRREAEILRYTAQGLSRAEIARRIAVSTKTVSTYKRRISMKTGLRNAAQITHYALDHHMIE